MWNTFSSGLSSTSYIVYYHLPFISGGQSAMRNLRMRRAAVKVIQFSATKLSSNTDLLVDLNIPKTEYFVKT